MYYSVDLVDREQMNKFFVVQLLPAEEKGKCIKVVRIYPIVIPNKNINNIEVTLQTEYALRS